MIKEEHILEYQKTGKISDVEILFDTDFYNPKNLPSNPFNFVSLISKGNFVEQLDPKYYGHEVAIIGGGCAGLCAGYELMRAGLKPVIYEASDRLGGRCHSFKFEGEDIAYAEVGAMRIPTMHETIKWYMDAFGLKRRPFPKPLGVSTVAFFNRKRYDIKEQGVFPDEIQSVVDEWDKLLSPYSQYISEVRNDLVELSKRWAELVEKYKNKSIIQVLLEKGWSKSLIERFGYIGAGGAPFGPFYHQVSFIEPLRVILSHWWGDIEMVDGGMVQIPLAFWETEVECQHWGTMSLKKLNGMEPQGAVSSIKKKDGKVLIAQEHEEGKPYQTAIVSCMPRNLDMNMRIDREVFSEEIWNAIRNIYLIPGGRICVLTKSAFWKDRPDLLKCTVTDEAITHLFPFEFPDTDKGVICLSYTIGVTAIKFDAFDDRGKLECCFRDIEKIYGIETVNMIREQMIGEPVCWTWEEAPGYNGSFKMPIPGFSEDELILFSQGKFDKENRHAQHNSHDDNGVYLAGDTVAWASGWIEGALQSAITSSISVIRNINSSDK